MFWQKTFVSGGTHQTWQLIFEILCQKFNKRAFSCCIRNEVLYYKYCKFVRICKILTVHFERIIRVGPWQQIQSCSCHMTNIVWNSVKEFSNWALVCFKILAKMTSKGHSLSQTTPASAECPNYIRYFSIHYGFSLITKRGKTYVNNYHTNFSCLIWVWTHKQSEGLSMHRVMQMSSV